MSRQHVLITALLLAVGPAAWASVTVSGYPYGVNPSGTYHVGDTLYVSELSTAYAQVQVNAASGSASTSRRASYSDPILGTRSEGNDGSGSVTESGQGTLSLDGHLSIGASKAAAWGDIGTYSGSRYGLASASGNDGSTSQNGGFPETVYYQYSVCSYYMVAPGGGEAPPDVLDPSEVSH